MTYADPTERTALITGLREMADYLDANPDVPAPVYPQFYVFPPDTGWAEMQAEINAVAARLGVIAYRTGGGHYQAGRSFGPISYLVVAIPPRPDEQSE